MKGIQRAPWISGTRIGLWYFLTTLLIGSCVGYVFGANGGIHSILNAAETMVALFNLPVSVLLSLQRYDFSYYHPITAITVIGFTDVLIGAGVGLIISTFKRNVRLKAE